MARKEVDYRTAVPSVEEKRKTQVIDEMIRLGLERRREILGEQFFDEVRNFYLFQPQIRTANPSFRPKFRFADLQMLVMQEAAELTDNTPLIYITHGDKRVKERERALRAQWQAGNFNMQIAYATLVGLMTGTGFIQYSYRPALYQGRGGVELQWWNPENVVTDPWCTSSRDWEYVILRVRMTYDEIRRSFKDGWRVIPTTGITPGVSNQMGYTTSSINQTDAIQLPPGPLRTVPIAGLGRAAPQGSPIVDFCFMRDSTRRKLKEDVTGGEDAFPAPTTVPMFPRGRLVVRSDEIVLYDGGNPYRSFPLVPIHMMPPLFGFWAPPPIRYTMPFQQLAETSASQVYENQIRLNNGYLVINRGSGLNKDRVRGLPGEILEVDGMQGKDAVVLLSPPAFPEHYITMPDRLLAKLRSTWGATDATAGKPAVGNTSVNLYEAAINQAQALTRWRARMLATAITELAQGIYGTLIDYQIDTSFPIIENGEMELVPWAGALPGELENWDVLVDPSSIKPVSMSARRSLVPVLRNMGMISVKRALEWLEIPDADEILKELKEESAMAIAQQEQRKQQRSRTNR